MLILIFLICLFWLIVNFKETFIDKIQCKKWIGNLDESPLSICKDCGYPEDCHGPYKGDLWRHIFRETPL